MTHTGTHRDRDSGKKIQRYIDRNYLISFLLPSPSPKSLSFPWALPTPLSHSPWHLLDMLWASRALNGLGSPPLLLLRDVILQKTALSSKWWKMCHTERGRATDTHAPNVPCLCFLLQMPLCLHHPHSHVKIIIGGLWNSPSYCIPILSPSGLL